MLNGTGFGAGALRLVVLSCVVCIPVWADREDRVIFAVSPHPALMDDRIAIRLAGLPPNHDVTLRARSRDQHEFWWRSSAVFQTRQDGSIDFSTQAPISGSYTGVDAMGLFWSMEPDGARRTAPTFFAVIDWFKPVVTEIEVVCDGRVVGTVQVIRRFAGPGVRAAPCGIDGVTGILYRPGDDRKHRGVILLGGSEGGFPTPQGAMLASRGYVVLALAYFGAPGLPATMQRIPLEYFGRAIHGMRSRPDVDGVAILGASRGGEAALLVGSLYPELDGVVAVSPSHVRWEGATARMLPGGPAWTYGGKPPPYIPFHIGIGFAARYLWSGITSSGLSLKPMFLDGLSRGDTEDVRIAVERIRGPVLLASGGDDRKWPSGLMSGRALDRLRRNHHPFADKHVSFEGAGHWVPCEYLPLTGLRGRMAEEIGGTPRATARAQSEWWPQLLEFLAALPSRHAAR